jgi:D-alanine-D-alanine ligase
LYRSRRPHHNKINPLAFGQVRRFYRILGALAGFDGQPSRRLRVGVVFGGRSGEHEVSLQSAQAVMRALEQAGHEVIPIGITKQGRWMLAGEQAVAMLPEPGQQGLVALDEGETTSLDVVFPVLHGTYGEDGTVQGLFELAGVPYVGSGVLGSALGMDKLVQKTLWRGLGLPVVDFVPVERCRLEAAPEAILHEIERAFGYPCFCKPVTLGSSVGVHKAHDRAELREGLLDAARYDTDLLVERGVDARELECSVLGNRDPIASVVGEVLSAEEFYSYRAKYLDAGSRTVIPAEISSELSEQVRELAIRAFKAVKACGLARVDFFLEHGTGQLYLNEINTMPGFTQISMYPKLWEASGLSFPQLVERLVQLALERFDERARNETNYAPADDTP